ncbi:hypothetical protein AMS68_002869 [Peltaster fructicola]|uniref:Kynurenine formamidase n=1 Tax=Peltaster fructicola TaxID=286661 RepID=A0A6H0XRG0_9PEZI|nr:hypothetical protein AMS68_002869 [Peltaster fructicola]
MSSSNVPVQWQAYEVKAPALTSAVPVIAAIDIPYISGGHRFQTLSLYAPTTAETKALIGQPAIKLPTRKDAAPRIHVHIHGGAWRDPDLTSRSIEAAAAHALRDGSNDLIDMIVSINYTLSPFPTHPTSPYDPIQDNHSDPAREAQHPQHVDDVLHAFNLLRTQYGLNDRSFILSGHSCGACLAFQSILKPPTWWGSTLQRPPTPAALVGFNGLYDLVELVQGLGPTHKNMREDYEGFQSIAFGKDKSRWPNSSPARFDVDEISARLTAGEVPLLVLLDQSPNDQLVPMNQTQRLELQLSLVEGLEIMKGTRCVGTHAAPWEQGDMIWETIKDVLKVLRK